MRHNTFYVSLLAFGLLSMAAAPASASQYAYCEGIAPSQTTCTDTFTGKSGGLAMTIQTPTPFVGQIQITLSASQLHYTLKCDITGISLMINPLNDCDSSGGGGYYVGETITMDVYVTSHSAVGAAPIGNWIVQAS